jgi:hypothetical protein
MRNIMAAGLAGIVLAFGMGPLSAAASPARPAEPMLQESPQKTAPPPADPARHPLVRLGFELSIGFSTIPRLINGAIDVPASIRFLPTIEPEPHLVASSNVETRTTMLFLMRAAPRIRIGPVSLAGGIEYPVNFENIMIDERAVYSLENFDAWYEACLRETTRFFVEAGFHPEESIRVGLGWMTSHLRYEFRSGNDKDTYIPSDYWFVPEHYVTHGIYEYYPVAEESYNRFYAFMEFSEDGLGAAVSLAYGNNPFQGRTYFYEGAPLSLTPGPSHAVTFALSFSYRLGK